MIIIKKMWRFLKISFSGGPGVQYEKRPPLDIMPQVGGSDNP